MPPKMSRSTDKLWAETFTNALQHPKRPQGEGWMTLVEIRERFKTGQRRTFVTVHALVKEGKMERFEGLQQKGQSLRRQVWYRPISLKQLKTR